MWGKRVYICCKDMVEEGAEYKGSFSGFEGREKVIPVVRVRLQGKVWWVWRKGGGDSSGSGETVG